MKVYVIEKWEERLGRYVLYDVTSSFEFASMYKYNPDFNVTEWMVK